MNIPDLHINTSQDVAQQIALFSGPVYALTNVVRRVNKHIDGGWVLVVALVISIIVGLVVAVAAFESVRAILYAVVALFLGAVGVHGTKATDTSTQDTPQQPPIPQMEIKKGS